MFQSHTPLTSHIAFLGLKQDIKLISYVYRLDFNYLPNLVSSDFVNKIVEDDQHHLQADSSKVVSNISFHCYHLGIFHVRIFLDYNTWMKTNRIVSGGQKTDKVGLSCKANNCIDAGTGNLGVLTTHETLPCLGECRRKLLLHAQHLSFAKMLRSMNSKTSRETVLSVI